MAKRVKAPREILEQVPPDYYEKGIRENIFQWVWHNWKWYAMKTTLAKLNHFPSKILDVGCAAGHITIRLAEFFPKANVIGLDSYDQAIDFGKKIHTAVDFRLGDAHELPFKNETFDLITCTETLEHLENPEKAVSEMKRCLKKNGFVLVGQDTDNFLFNLVWSIWTKTRGKVWQDSHIHPLTSKLLEEILKKRRLKIKVKKFSQLGLEVFFLAQK